METAAWVRASRPRGWRQYHGLEQSEGLRHPHPPPPPEGPVPGCAACQVPNRAGGRRGLEVGGVGLEEGVEIRGCRPGYLAVGLDTTVVVWEAHRHCRAIAALPRLDLRLSTPWGPAPISVWFSGCLPTPGLSILIPRQCLGLSEPQGFWEISCRWQLGPSAASPGELSQPGSGVQAPGVPC